MLIANASCFYVTFVNFKYSLILGIDQSKCSICLFTTYSNSKMRNSEVFGKAFGKEGRTYLFMLLPGS